VEFRQHLVVKGFLRMREHHDAEKPAESSHSHEQSDQNSPPEDPAGTFLFLGEIAAAVGAMLAPVAHKSNMHNNCEKVIGSNSIEIFEEVLPLLKKERFFCE
jgi:hypothetical protein